MKVLNEMKVSFPQPFAERRAGPVADGGVCRPVKPHGIGTVGLAHGGVGSRHQRHCARVPGHVRHRVHNGAAVARAGAASKSARPGAWGSPILKRPWNRFIPPPRKKSGPGWGFAVMQSFCDRVKVHSRPGAGTTVTLEKKLLPPGGDEAGA